jgi:tetratricopeptide (TPR) repeat protein
MHRFFSRQWAHASTAILIAWSAFASAPAAVQESPKWEQLEHSGTAALEANEFWIAEPALKQALSEAEKFGVHDIRLAKTLGSLGRLYTIRGRFADAEPYLEEELQVKEVALGDQSDEIVPAMGSLIRFYLNHGTSKKADPLAEEMLAMVEGKMKEARPQSKLKLKKGEPLTGWLGAAAPVVHERLIDWAIACDATGSSFLASNNLDMAERFFKAALDLKTTVLGKDHLSLANSYDSLGSIALARDDYATAELDFADALDISEHNLEPQSAELYARLDKLAKCLIKENKYADAQQLYIHAQSYWKDAPPKYGEESRDFYALGALYCKEKNYESAEPVLKRALESAEQFYGPESNTLVPYLQQYAYALYYLGKKFEVDQLKERANTISGVDKPPESAQSALPLPSIR